MHLRRAMPGVPMAVQESRHDLCFALKNHNRKGNDSMNDLLIRMFSALEQWLTGSSSSVEAEQPARPVVSYEKIAEYDYYIRSNVGRK